jgi:hypothetical protein
MSRSRDASLRAAAFRAFSDSRPDPDAARLDLGLSPRSWQRMRNSATPPPPRLLIEIADSLDDAPLLEAQLRAAAANSEARAHA